ncbi:MAG: A/G-specific adenine glycosylase [Chloroflexi bacterium]|nr:A/G-specific adenine glycosylase [Chloroflexota bacterium]
MDLDLAPPDGTTFTDRPPPAHAAVHAAVLGWYARHGRDLPWRRTSDPYHVLVSEFMLQQTQVERVIPKYHAFLGRFPTLAALAEAPVAEVIRAWSGLGYNRRAVALQQVARQVIAEHGGVIPDDPAVLAGLRGIGAYTAGAVACFGYRRDVAFIDTNIRRVLHRVYHGPEAPVPLASARELTALATAALPAGHGYDWGQALMDLGALVCTAGRPLCPACPLVDLCRAAPAFLRYGLPERAVRALRERPTNGRAAVPFTQTARYFRGRIVDALRALPPDEALPLAALGPRLRDDYTPEHAPWLHDLVIGLAADGLVALAGPPDALLLALPS